MPAGLIITLLLLFAPYKSTPTKTLNYTNFLRDVKAQKIKTASINPTGGVDGNAQGR